MNLIDAVALARNGENAGYTFLYENTYKKSYYIALKYLKNEQAALDVLQDSYIKAFENIDQLENASKFESWFGSIVAKRSLNELRKNNPLLFSETVNDDEEDISFSFEDDRIDSRPDLAIDQKETSRLVREIMDGLSDEQRICITMYYMEELSIKEISVILSVSDSTVKSRLNYGRNKIKAKVLELEKKGTKLYGMLPFVFFLALFKKDAMASSVTIPAIESVVRTFKQTSVKAGATVSPVAKTGFVIGGHVISTKILIGFLSVVVAISGGLVWTGISRRTMEDNQARVYIDFYDVGNEAAIIYGEAETRNADTNKIRKRNAILYTTNPVDNAFYNSATYVAEYKLGEKQSFYAKVYDGIVYIVAETNKDIDGSHSFSMLEVKKDNSIVSYDYGSTYLDGINEYGYNTYDNVAYRIKETQFDFSTWVDISKFGKYGLDYEDAYDYSKEHNDEWVSAIFATEESLEQYISENEENAVEEVQVIQPEDILEVKIVEETNDEVIMPENGIEDDSIDMASESETKANIAMVSDTNSEIEVGGSYKSDDGKKISVSIYTDEDPNFIGSVEFDGNALELKFLGQNIYLLSADYMTVVDSGYRIVANSDNSINLFLNGEFIRNYKLQKRFYS